MLVQLETELEAGRQLAYRATQLINDDDDMAIREISMAKLFCGELAQRVIDRCLQLHGGMGYMAETEVSRLWRDARPITIGGGTWRLCARSSPRCRGWRGGVSAERRPVLRRGR